MSVTATEKPQSRRRKRFGLSSQIVYALVAGIAFGLFFGEMVAGLKVIGDVFIKLLQMTVLPYILVSLITGVGRLNAAEARVLAVRGMMVLVVIWTLAISLVFAAQLAFPERETASFFSMSALETRPQPDVLERFIPANIFYSLTHNLVPAVVLFSILLGSALISIQSEHKTQLLGVMDSTLAALARVNQFVVQLTPIGVFAIAAAAAGTMTITELERIQVYLVTYVAVAVTVTFWIFPGLVSAVTGIRFSEVLDTYKDALITAFATGNQFIVLPLIAENTKALMQRHNLRSEQTDSSIDVLVPVSFNFPSLGKLLVLLFVLFSAWYTGTSLDFTDQLGLAFNGLFSLFGNINVAVPYLLDSVRIPADMFQLFVLTGIVIGRLGAMLAALHIIVLAIVGTLAIAGQLRISGRSILRYVVLSILVTTGLIAGLRLYFEFFVPHEHTRQEALAEMHRMEERVDAKVRRSLGPPGGTSGTDRLDAILNRGVLRVGFRPDRMPCSFVNLRDELVGFDIEMAHILAADLGVILELAPITGNNYHVPLNTGQVDIVIGCMAATPRRQQRLDLSESYIDVTLAFIVADHRRGDFETREAVQSLPEVTVAVTREGYFANRLRLHVPQAEVVVIDSPTEFLEGRVDADALLYSAEVGAAYSLLYPRFTVAIPEPGHVKIPIAYALPKGERQLKDMINTWIELQQKNGTIDRMLDYWMLGGATRPEKPRWSIIRDVLHWVE